MKLSELINQHTWAEVSPEWVKLYPRRASRMEEYQQLYADWQDLTPAETDMVIQIEPYHKSMFDLEPKPKLFPIISGRHQNKHYHLERISWEEWMGANIDKNAQKTYTQIQIICHCIREMTSLGFSQDAIQGIRMMEKEEAEYYMVDKMLAERTVDTGYLSKQSKRTGRKQGGKQFSLQSRLAPFIIGCLKDYLNYDRAGIPGIIPHHIHNFDGGVEVWDEILQDMIFAFEFLLHKNDEKFMRNHGYTAESEQVQERVQRGFDLFGIYYTMLWD